ncbi:X-box-binding protein 1-like [Dendronephthya gigantea]|uniref:X-box-binding protein 1-like n=1 Tax=Dendronephthya gigantea TaxID=151771 RepID=UPI00106B2F5F|nr:X-box-binding protein 1-like [Dendronephthya gigantea]
MALINPAILMDPPCEPGCPRKRRRLDNLTPEERALRRKLKNRVAAQTARDRKKARMTELEESLAIFEEQNRKLMKENKDLKLRASSLESENTELKTRLGLSPPSSPTNSEENTPSPPPTPPHSPSQDEPAVVVVKQEKESSEYAELSVSQQKEHSPIPFLSLLTTTVLLHLLSLMSFSAFLKISSQATPTISSASNKNQKTYSSSAQESLKSPSLKKNEETKNFQKEWGKTQKAWNPPAENS